MPVFQDSRVEQISLDQLRPHPRNARNHSKKQVKQIAASIERFGFTNPVLVSDDFEIIAGHGRVLAARQVRLETVPVIRLSHLNAAERRAYMLADNKHAMNASWDQDMLADELQQLIELDFDLSVSGFEACEIDILIDAAVDADPKSADPDDTSPEPADFAVTRSGDVWLLGRHRLVCGDACDPAAYDALLGDERVDLVFTDPPYNVAIHGNVCGNGRVRHREFLMASGEMSPEQFTGFLKDGLGAAASRCRDGAIAFVCMDWRHMGELLEAGKAVFSELKNLCVWNKNNGGQSAFYRSKHELVFVYKVGTGEHVNTFGLGGGGRYRTNVWDYAGISSIGASRDAELAMHPTVKPVALIRDAILDCSHRGDIVLDCFAGSGSTLVAAHRSGRVARLIEYDPIYCDVIVQRYERLTGKLAVLAATGQTSEEVAEERLSEGCDA